MVWKIVNSDSPKKRSVPLKVHGEGVTIESGDVVIFKVEDDIQFPELGLVIDIVDGLKPHLTVLMFNERDDMDIDVDDNELVLTPVKEHISLKSIRKKANCEQYVFKRASDEHGEKVTDLDFNHFVAMVKEDATAAHEFLKELIFPTKVPSLRRSPRKTALNRVPIVDDGEEVSSDDYEDIHSDSESGVEDLMFYSAKSSPKPKKTPKSTRSSPTKSSPTKSSPTKRKVPSTPTKSKRIKPDTPLGGDENSESLQFIQSLLGNKRIRISSSLPAPNFTVQSPKPKRKASKEGDYQLLDTKSPAFKDLKQKLHTATKLSSLPCREDEFTSLYLHIDSAIREQTGCCLYISGTPGIGKTATIREVMNQLKELNTLGEINDFQYVEINALKLISPNHAYDELWSKISGLNVSSSNAALFLEAYFKEQSESKKPLVVMIDELDQIATKKQNVMYNFFNWPTYQHSKLIVIAVANTMDLPERVLLNKISSRLGLKRLQFIGYTFEQLGSIIEHRLDMLTRENKRLVIVDKDAISFASRKVSSVSGDARRALQICRRAVEIAEAEYQLRQAETIDPEDYIKVEIPHISKAINETINSPVAQYIASLSYGSKLILVALLLRTRRSGLSENSLGDIIDEMKNIVSLVSPSGESELLGHYDIKISQGMRINEFRYLFLELVENGILNSQNIKSERYKLVSLNVSTEEVMATLRRDKQVSHLL